MAVILHLARGFSRAYRRLRRETGAGRSEAEEKEEVDAGALDAPERVACAERLCVGERRANPQQAGDVVLDRRLVVRLEAELAREAGDEARRDLLANRDAGCDARPRIGGRLDLEDVETELALNCRDEGIGEESGGEDAGPDQQILLLFGGELVRLSAEHDEREDVRLIERRI